MYILILSLQLLGERFIPGNPISKSSRAPEGVRSGPIRDLREWRAPRRGVLVTSPLWWEGVWVSRCVVADEDVVNLSMGGSAGEVLLLWSSLERGCSRSEH
jgi:hypothetical protein